MADRYWVGGSGLWSDATNHWAASSGGAPDAGNIPGNSDDVYFDSNSHTTSYTVTGVSSPNVCRSMIWANPASGSPAFTSSAIFGIYGNLTLVAGMTFTITGSEFNKLKLLASAGTFTIDSAGVTINASIEINSTATYQLASALTIPTTKFFYNTNGVFDANDFNVSVGRFKNFTGKTTSMGNGTWTLTGTGAVWTADGTVNVEGATITLSDVSATAKTFAGGSKTYNAVTITGGGAGAWTITGANTFSTFTINKPKTVYFTSGTTNTFTSFVATGDVSNVITLASDTASAATLSDSAGTNTVYYCSITNLTATGGATWNALTSDGNVDNGGNTGWNFSSGAIDITVTPSALALLLSLKTPTINYGYTLIPSPLGLNLALNDPSVALGSDSTVTAPVFGLTLTQPLSLIQIGTEVAVSSALSLTLALQDPANYIIIEGVTVSPSAFSLGLTLNTPTISAGEAGTFIVYDPDTNQFQMWKKGVKSLWIE